MASSAASATEDSLPLRHYTSHLSAQARSLAPKHVEANQGILGISTTSVSPDPVQVLESYKNAFSLRSDPLNHLVLLYPPTIGAGVQSVPYSNLMAPNYNSSVLGSAFAPIANMLYWYSKWIFTLTPKYTTIKEGQNKIAAKYSCANTPGSLSHNSVNVTGVATKNLKSTNPRID